MINTIATLLLFLVMFSGYAQSSEFLLHQRSTPTVKKENLSQFQTIEQMIPDFWTKVTLSEREYWRMKEVMDQVRATEPAQASAAFPQPQGAYPKSYYDRAVKVVSMEIATTVNGREVTTRGKDHRLTDEQKNMLSRSDWGANFKVRVKFQYKTEVKKYAGTDKEPAEAHLTATVVPHSEAEFAGGLQQMTAFFLKQVIDKAHTKNAAERVQSAILKFTVDENGEVINACLSRPTADARIDLLLMEALKNMPRWKPAMDAKGNHVKQEFTWPLGHGGC